MEIVDSDITPFHLGYHLKGACKGLLLVFVLTPFFCSNMLAGEIAVLVMQSHLNYIYWINLISYKICFLRNFLFRGIKRHCSDVDVCIRCIILKDSSYNLNRKSRGGDPKFRALNSIAFSDRLQENTTFSFCSKLLQNVTNCLPELLKPMYDRTEPSKIGGYTHCCS